MGTIRVSIGVGVERWPRGQQPNYLVAGFENSQFDEKNASAFIDFVDRGLSRHRSAQGYDGYDARKVTSLPVLIIIENWTDYFRRILLAKFPRFSKGSLDLLEAREKMLGVLPSFDASSGDFNFVMNHIKMPGEQSRAKLKEKLSLRDEDHLLIPLAVYGCSSMEGQAVMIFVGEKAAPSLIEILKKNYIEDDQRRWERLGQNPLWVVLDLVRHFTDWSPVLEAMKVNLKRANENGKDGTFLVMVRTRLLHGQMAKVIEWREVLRIHQAIAERVTELSVDHPEDGELSTRLENFKAQMKYDATTINTIMEQLKNLIQLEFNLEAVSQGQSVARLSALAFVFIPLSYVASVFSIPTLSIGAKWYPASAVPLLFVTILVAVLGGKLVKSWESQSLRAYERAPNNGMTVRKLFARSEKNEPKKDLEMGEGVTGAPAGLDETESLGPQPPPPPPLYPPLGSSDFGRPQLTEDGPEGVRRDSLPLPEIREESPTRSLRHPEPNSPYSHDSEDRYDNKEYGSGEYEDAEEIFVIPGRTRNGQSSEATSSGRVKPRPRRKGNRRKWEEEEREGEERERKRYVRESNSGAYDRDPDRDSNFHEYARSRTPSSNPRHLHPSNRPYYADPNPAATAAKDPETQRDELSREVHDKRGGGGIAGGFSHVPPRVPFQSQSAAVHDKRGGGGIASGFSRAPPRGSFEGPPKYYSPTHPTESAQMSAIEEKVARLEKAFEANRRLQHTETPATEERPKGKGKGRLSFLRRSATIP